MVGLCSRVLSDSCVRRSARSNVPRGARTKPDGTAVKVLSRFVPVIDSSCMRKRRTLLQRLLLIVAVILLAVPLVAWLLLRASVPKLEGDAVVPGLSAPVTIER